MSVLGISLGGLLDYSTLSTQSVQSKKQQFAQEFQQLGTDLQSGNLSAAQTDFATLQQLGSQSNSTSSSQNSDPIVQAFNQLSKDLQSGNITAAQQDYATIQQDFQNLAAKGHHHHHRSSGSNSATSEISQLLSQLGQALQSGNLASAQQSYSTLQQDFPQLTPTSGTTASTQSGSSSFSVSA